MRVFIPIQVAMSGTYGDSNSRHRRADSKSPGACVAKAIMVVLMASTCRFRRTNEARPIRCTSSRYAKHELDAPRVRQLSSSAKASSHWDALGCCRHPRFQAIMCPGAKNLGQRPRHSPRWAVERANVLVEPYCGWVVLVRGVAGQRQSCHRNRQDAVCPVVDVLMPAKGPETLQDVIHTIPLAGV